MNETRNRTLLYGATALVLGGLGYAVATQSTEADTITLLSSADVQLRLAYGIPERDKHGVVMSQREQMIDSAIENLGRVELANPGLAVTAEFRGFAHMLRGEFRDAAACYSRARQCRDCEDEQRDVLAFNEARMLWQAGDGEAALRVFADNARALDSRFGNQRAIEEAAILRGLGRQGDAVSRLDAVIADGAAEPMARVQAAIELIELGHEGRAEAALLAASADVPIADYHIARLKLRRGEVDNAMDCLERAAAAAPADVVRLVREEPDTWQALSTNARFAQIAAPAAATPGR